MSSTANIIFTVMYAITMIVSLVGNTLLIYIVWKKPDVRSLTSFMFVNMAVADLLVTLVVIPYTISHFYLDGVWLLTGVIGEITCKMVIFVAFFTISASILCLTFMAVDRFYAVVYPFQRLLWFRKPKVLTPLVWVLSMALMSIVPVFIVLTHNNSEYKCEAAFYVLGDESIAIPGIIAILYTITARKLWYHEAPGEDLGQLHQQQEITKRRVVRMLVIVFTVFALCWLPGQVFQMYMAAVEWVDLPDLRSACYWFGYNNSAINPWLYIGMNSKIHKAFSRMISKKPSNMENPNLRTEDKEMAPTSMNQTQDTHI
ncbi:hypothetical protein OS493_017510 [Desmophyllum pertusum]|uniref:G-protein coupled receptors family 1 profile domain-containing protein n=1 Tax=Desmophyllum pertusum TaxID=174260 RepID=A0A9X0D491_9CNID|nr:hypothetical protein OS493_017510 [Desmophyllum pertusum]